MNEVAHLAANLARNTGWSVFPVLASKKPATPHGYKDATSDLGAVVQLWRDHPGPLIGIATGTVSGIDLLDFDIKHRHAIAYWLDHEHNIPATRTYRSRGGGLHLIHQHAAGVGCTAGKICEGVDTRGDGGYAIFWFAAGFDCLDHTAPAAWPTWLLDVIHALKRPELSVPPVPFQANTQGGIDALLRTIKTASEGNRNALLFWVGCRIAERVRVGQLGAGEAERLLYQVATQVGLPDIEARMTIRSALGKAFP